MYCELLPIPKESKLRSINRSNVLDILRTRIRLAQLYSMNISYLILIIISILVQDRRL